MRLVAFGPGHRFRGGIARTTRSLVEALQARGHEVLFLSAVRQYPAWLYPGASDRDPDPQPALHGELACLDPFDPLTWPGVRRRALAAAADAWIVPYWTWVWAPLWRVLLGAPDRPPAAVVVHNPSDHDGGPLRRLAAGLVLGRCDGLFTHARTLAEQLESSWPGVPVAHHLLPGPPPGPLPDRAAARRQLGLAENARVALFLGLIRPYKGVDVLLDAWADPRVPPDWHLVVAGEPWGDLAAAVPARAAALGLGGRVTLRLGWVPEDEVALLLAAADVVVLPYRSGSQSAVAPLALAHGLPVLTTEVGGLPELVADGRNGVVVPPGSAAELAGAVSRLDAATLARLAAGARQASPGWDGYAQALEGLLGSLSR